MVGGPVGDFELLLCHGTVCVVGKIRDLILQLSKSSIYSTKPIPVINIIDATLEHIAPQGKRVVVLGSQMLYQSRLYQDALTQQHAEIVNVAASTQQLVTRCINEIKATKSVSELSMRQLADAVSSWKQQGATHIILACTELSLLKHSAIWQEMTLIDSSEALARAALRAISFRRLRD
ncbi:hypothetical protein GAY20_07260 [Pantoea dispersa]|nr:hypothetical protein GAY20_07260 [Pantoea dispersa]